MLEEEEEEEVVFTRENRGLEEEVVLLVKIAGDPLITQHAQHWEEEVAVSLKSRGIRSVNNTQHAQQKDEEEEAVVRWSTVGIRTIESWIYDKYNLTVHVRHYVAYGRAVDFCAHATARSGTVFVCRCV